MTPLPHLWINWPARWSTFALIACLPQTIQKPIFHV
jgi:hypothetical protein